MAVFSPGYKGKTRQFAETDACHRTTIAHFLNKGKWNSAKLEELLKKAVINIIYSEAARTGMPIYCFVDDTISSKTKPSSKALHPIQDAYYHQSHLKKKQDYGHQAVAVMLSCNGITLNYAIVMYDKTKSKIQIVQEIARELPVCPVRSYFLCDSWYTCAKIVTAFREKGFHTIGAIKTNRLVSFDGDKLQLGQLAAAMLLAGRDADLVTVGKRRFFVYFRVVKIENIGQAVVLLSYPREAFGNPSALRAFVCTDTSLSVEQILRHYVVRWNIEVFSGTPSRNSPLISIKYVLLLVFNAFGSSCHWLILSAVWEPTGLFPLRMDMLIFKKSLLAQCWYLFFKNSFEKR